MKEDMRVQEATPVETAWQRYPNLDAAIEGQMPLVVSGMRKTRDEIGRVLETGSERERERARMILTAYDNALDLYRRLTDLRDEAFRNASNMSVVSPITE